MCECDCCDCCSCPGRCPRCPEQCDCTKVVSNGLCRSCNLTTKCCGAWKAEEDCCACMCFRCENNGTCSHCFCEGGYYLEDADSGGHSNGHLLVNRWSTHYCQCDEASGGPLGEEWCLALMCLPCTTALAKTRVDNSNAITNILCYAPCPASVYSFVRNEYRIRGSGQDWCAGCILCAPFTTRRALSESRRRFGASPTYLDHNYVAALTDAETLPNTYQDGLCSQDGSRVLAACFCPCCYAGDIRNQLQPTNEHCCCFDCLQIPCAPVGQARHALKIQPACGGNGKRDDICVACFCYPCAMARADAELRRRDWSVNHLETGDQWAQRNQEMHGGGGRVFDVRGGFGGGGDMAITSVPKTPPQPMQHTSAFGSEHMGVVPGSGVGNSSGGGPPPVMNPMGSRSARSTKWCGPPGWERMVDPNGVFFYVDHGSKATHWQPPAGYPDEEEEEESGGGPSQKNTESDYPVMGGGMMMMGNNNQFGRQSNSGGSSTGSGAMTGFPGGGGSPHVAGGGFGSRSNSIGGNNFPFNSNNNQHPAPPAPGRMGGGPSLGSGGGMMMVGSGSGGPTGTSSLPPAPHHGSNSEWDGGGGGVQPKQDGVPPPKKQITHSEFDF